jgi:hypothetical protein
MSAKIKYVFFLLLAVSSKFCSSQINCEGYLDVNKTRVNQLINHARGIDTFWNTHIKYLSIVLPEFLSESENGLANEIQIVKVLNSLGFISVDQISVGPFQMQSRFMYNVLAPSELKNPKFCIGYIVDNLEIFGSLNLQLKILKLFIINNEKYMKGDDIKNRIFKLAALYNGIIKNYKEEVLLNEKFSKLDCLNLTYPKAALFLMEFYRI